MIEFGLDERSGVATMSAHRKPGLSRRRLLNAAAGTGASAAGLTACTSSGPVRPAATGRGLADVVPEALKTHRLVALGAADSLQNHYDVLGLLLTGPRLPGVAGDIIAEWGNALYQDTVDKFIAGQPVADAGLRPVWRNTTQSPLETWDAPVDEQFYRMPRAVNWTLPPGQRIRVLAGDSPLDWAKITKPGQLRAVPPRGPFAASLVQQQVLARGRRALLCYGMTGLFHGTGMTGAIERQTGQRIYVIADLVPLAGDPGGLAQRLSRYPRDTVIPAAGTWLGFLQRRAVCGTSPPRRQEPLLRGAAGIADRRRPVPGPARRADRHLARPGHLLPPGTGPNYSAATPSPATASTSGSYGSSARPGTR